MKEKIKKVVKSRYVSVLMKIITGFLLLILLSFVGVVIYSFVFERDQIAIDRYNFEQGDEIQK